MNHTDEVKVYSRGKNDVKSELATVDKFPGMKNAIEDGATYYRDATFPNGHSVEVELDGKNNTNGQYFQFKMPRGERVPEPLSGKGPTTATFHGPLKKKES